jgi:AcrR family transcriptional regulator
MYSYLRRVNMGLREIKKERARKAILKAARKMFFTLGYDGTTIETIAENADIAVGTVYNYFESKSAIILAITSEDTSKVLDDNFEISESDPGFNCVRDFIFTFMESLAMYPRMLIRELMREAWNVDGTLSNGLIRQDLTLLNSLERLLSTLAETGRLKLNTNIEHAAMVIYGSLITALMWYAADKDRTSEDVLASIEIMLDVLFRGLAPEGSME